MSQQINVNKETLQDHELRIRDFEKTTKQRGKYETN